MAIDLSHPGQAMRTALDQAQQRAGETVDQLKAQAGEAAIQLRTRRVLPSSGSKPRPVTR